jgi:hypothetical protein
MVRPPIKFIDTMRHYRTTGGIHALDDRRFAAGKRHIFDAFFPLRPAEMPSTKRIHGSEPFETADHFVERADGR